MADFRPFRGIRYEPSAAGPLGALVCPPYDAISEAHERELLERSPHNMVRLELAERPEPLPSERYADAAKHFHQWLDQGVLRRDSEPGFYLVQQRFPYARGTAERYSLTGALRLETLGQGVLPHEETAEAPKRDRLALMQACEANFSPIMALYQDDADLMETVRHRAMDRPPQAELATPDGQHFALWRITDDEPVRAVREALASQPLFVADGHHRYETALTYRNQMENQGGGGTASRHVMVSLIDFDDPGLLVLPYHRVVGGMSPELYGALRERMRELLTIQPASVEVRTSEPLEALVAQEGATRPGHGPGRP